MQKVSMPGHLSPGKGASKSIWLALLKVKGAAEWHGTGNEAVLREPALKTELQSNNFVEFHCQPLKV